MAVSEWTRLTLHNSASQTWWTQPSASGRRYSMVYLIVDYRVNGSNMEYIFSTKDDKHGNTIDITFPYSGGEKKTVATTADTYKEVPFTIPIADLISNTGYRPATKDINVRLQCYHWAADGTRQAAKKSITSYVPVLDALKSGVKVNVGGSLVEATAFVNVGGTWCEASPFVNVGGEWKESI